MKCADMIQNAASKKIVVEPYAQESPTTPQHNHGKYFFFQAQVAKMNVSFCVRIKEIRGKHA